MKYHDWCYWYCCKCSNCFKHEKDCVPKNIADEYPEHKLHCDRCGRALGTYLYGKGGIEEIAYIGTQQTPVSLPDMFCRDREVCEDYRISHHR